LSYESVTYKDYLLRTIPSTINAEALDRPYDFDNPSDSMDYATSLKTYFFNTLGTTFSEVPANVFDSDNFPTNINMLMGYSSKIDDAGKPSIKFKQLIISDLLCSLATIVATNNSDISIDEIPGF
jgi:hypothetical protein